MAPGRSIPPQGKGTKNSKTSATDKVGKSTDSAKTQDQKKKQVVGRKQIQKLELVRDTSRIELEKARQTLDQAFNAYENGAHPEHKDEYERLAKAFNQDSKKLEDYESELNQLKEEQTVLDAMDEDTDPTTNSVHPLFITDPAPPGTGFGASAPLNNSLSEGPPASPPSIGLIDEEGVSKPLTTDEDPEDAGLFTPDQNNVASGRIDDGKVVAWRRQGYSKQVIILYGRENSPKYEHSTKSKAGIPFDEKTTKKFGPDYRFGDEKRDRKLVRQWDEFKGILGVAYNGPLKALKPKEKGEERKYPRIHVRVKWSIDGEIHRVWEVPSSIKHIWPNSAQCEEYIYNAACDHNEKYQAWKSGQREGKDASPSPGPGIKIEENGRNGITPHKGLRSYEERMLQYRQEWAAKKKLDPEKLSMMQMVMFSKDWENFENEEEL